MSNNTYNGWTNYATWRINLEIFDGYDCNELANMSPDEMQDFAEEIVEQSSTEGLARDYAMAFLSDVNWYEIASHYNEENEGDE